MKLEPYKSQPVLFRAVAGDEYAAIITDVREGNECCVTVFWPANNVTAHFSRVKYFHRKADAAGYDGSACYPGI